MRKILTITILLSLVLASTPVFARGQAADDCPPGSTDPDCIKSGK